MLTVLKFGGSSLADAQCLRRSAGIAAEKAREGGAAVVVSARGKTTDRLLGEARAVSPSPTPRELDALVSTGENGSAALTAMQLADLGQRSVSLSGAQAGIYTDGVFGNANIVRIDPARILGELCAGNTVVVAGFQGISPSGDVTTLGRGGSDTTAVALAAALEADECEIYSDVDGVYTADPRLVPTAKRLDEIDYADMLRLSLGGSRVLHSKSVETAMNTGVEPLLLSSFARGGGTRLRRVRERPELCGVTRDKSKSAVTLVGDGADVGILSLACDALRRVGITPAFSSVQTGACVIGAAPESLDDALLAVHARFFA